MAKGRGGVYLEAWKFAMYLAIPVTASWYYNDPNRIKEQADYWQLVKYPANPNTNMREQIEDMVKQEEQMRAYRKQIQELDRQAARTDAAAAAAAAEARGKVVDETSTADGSSSSSSGRGGWLRWIGLGGRNKEET